jgi:hypothetical protein
MRTVLNLHPSIRLAGETHYFDDLRVRFRGRERESLDADGMQMCEDYFLALSHRPYGHGGAVASARLAREELRDEARRCGRGPDSYFEAFCRITARREGAPVWGEKTPRHVFRLAEIFDLYPRAKVVCMVRDPRAVVLSYRDWRNQGGFDLEADPGHAETIALDNERAHKSYNLLLMSLLWRSQTNAAQGGRERFGGERVFLQRYEDLVDDPVPAIQKLCAWLGVEFDIAMLQVPVLNSSFSKFDRAGGFSRSSLDLWRQHLSGDELAVIQATCARQMAGLGYERVQASSPMAVVREWLALPFSSARAIRANSGRLGRLVPYVTRRARLLVRRS